MRTGGREIRNNCADPWPVQALFEGAVLPCPQCPDCDGSRAAAQHVVMGQSRRSSKDRFEAVFIAKFALRNQRPCDLLCKVDKPFRRGTERSVLQGGDAGWPIRTW
jgi:hypothetical protein